MIYLDHAATTPLAPEVREAMDEAAAALSSGECANPSSVHGPGRKARAMLNRARAELADHWAEFETQGCSISEIAMVLRLLRSLLFVGIPLIARLLAQS